MPTHNFGMYGVEWAEGVSGLLQVWVATSDAGPDIVAGRSFMEKEISGDDKPFTWFLDSDCFIHQYQLISKGLIVSMGLFIMPALGLDYQYYGALASILHILRDIAKEILHYYREQHTKEEVWIRSSNPGHYPPFSQTPHLHIKSIVGKHVSSCVFSIYLYSMVMVYKMSVILTTRSELILSSRFSPLSIILRTRSYNFISL